MKISNLNQVYLLALCLVCSLVSAEIVQSNLGAIKLTPGLRARFYEVHFDNTESRDDRRKFVDQKKYLTEGEYLGEATGVTSIDTSYIRYKSPTIYGFHMPSTVNQFVIELRGYYKPLKTAPMNILSMAYAQEGCTFNYEGTVLSTYARLSNYMWLNQDSGNQICNENTTNTNEKYATLFNEASSFTSAPIGVNGGSYTPIFQAGEYYPIRIVLISRGPGLSTLFIPTVNGQWMDFSSSNLFSSEKEDYDAMDASEGAAFPGNCPQFTLTKSASPVAKFVDVVKRDTCPSSSISSSSSMPSSSSEVVSSSSSEVVPSSSSEVVSSSSSEIVSSSSSEIVSSSSSEIVSSSSSEIASSSSLESISVYSSDTPSSSSYDILTSSDIVSSSAETTASSAENTSSSSSGTTSSSTEVPSSSSDRESRTTPSATFASSSSSSDNPVNTNTESSGTVTSATSSSEAPLQSSESPSFTTSSTPVSSVPFGNGTTSVQPSVSDITPSSSSTKSLTSTTSRSPEGTQSTPLGSSDTPNRRTTTLTSVVSGQTTTIVTVTDCHGPCSRTTTPNPPASIGEAQSRTRGSSEPGVATVPSVVEVTSTSRGTATNSLVVSYAGDAAATAVNPLVFTVLLFLQFM
ncbi:hypothetical protein DAKH74_023540 [Maudiozyma humilis]|uniref:Uncharacterized protein n=1 Tax=Maudiozyma humilis TaxID=51915 RepID=A0AAV5RYP8_MAUHU|nr:hypothetical protein DAKH74_023540 [Kazachstania humilis]